MSTRTAFALSLSSCLLFAGCVSMAPRYERPDAPVAEAWPESDAYAGVNENAPTSLPAWDAFFADDKLRSVVALALENNRDLRTAALNVERAKQLYRVQRADSLPEVVASSQGNISHLPASVSASGSDIDTRYYTATIGITAFEIDLFGRLRSLNRNALESYFATEAARNAAQISLIAETASAYLTYSGDLALLKLAQQTLDSQEQSFELTQRRFEAGASSELDVHRASIIVESARADVARFTALAAQDENALTLLIGAPLPDALKPAPFESIAFGIDDLNPSFPSETLLARPDIEQAEHQLRAANANIGAARAAFFPRITIAGASGEADPRFENLLQNAGETWSITPRVDLPIFQGGARLANLGVSKADRDIAVAAYERAIQSAFREVADALATRGTIEDELAARESLASSAESAFTISEARYRQGVDDYLSLLDSQRELYSAQQALVSTRVARAVNFVDLYRAMGGGV